MKYLLCFIFSMWAMFLAACTENKPQKTESGTERRAQTDPPVVALKAYKLGEVVPHDEVCMVNNAYMGKKQIEVNLDGRVYYGCCEMCKKRIPEDESVRMAIDPISKRQVDKAGAIIAITGVENEVSYFENKTNYEAFFK